MISAFENTTEDNLATKDNVWVARTSLSRVCAVALFILPIVAAWFAVRSTSGFYYRPDGFLELPLWLIQAILVTVATCYLVTRATRQFATLPSLLRVGLVWPGTAPSRVAIARTSATTNVLARTLTSLPTDEEAATVRAVEMVTMLSQDDAFSRGHAERTRDYADLIAVEMGLTEAERVRLQWGVLLHDIGKMAVSRNVIQKQGLSANEWKQYREHTKSGERILLPLKDFLGSAYSVPSQHHERWDGTGYPDGAIGKRIGLEARICSVADAYDAMTYPRPGLTSLSDESATHELVDNAGSQFDPAVVEAMLATSKSKRLAIAGLISRIPVPGAISLRMSTFAKPALATALAAFTLPLLSTVAISEAPELPMVPMLVDAVASATGLDGNTSEVVSDPNDADFLQGGPTLGTPGALDRNGNDFAPGAIALEDTSEAPITEAVVDVDLEDSLVEDEELADPADEGVDSELDVELTTEADTGDGVDPEGAGNTADAVDLVTTTTDFADRFAFTTTTTRPRFTAPAPTQSPTTRPTTTTTAPRVTTAPATTRAPRVTAAPATTRAPRVTAAPTTTRAPRVTTTTTTRAPTTTRPPTTTTTRPQTTTTTTTTIPAPVVNRALGQPTTQSSTAFSGAASRATDGNVSGVWTDRSVTHTNIDEIEPWLQVDLGQVGSISEITIWGRTDSCCTFRLNDAVVFVSNTSMASRSLADLEADSSGVTSFSVDGELPRTTTIDAKTSGRYVMVMLRDVKTLSLAELIVLS